MILKRSFYTPVVPKGTPRLILEDGSILIFKKKQEHNHPLLSSTPQESTSTNLSSANESLLPPPTQSRSSSYASLTPSQISRMKALRASDPDAYTVLTLAREFHVHPTTVLKHTSCSVERKQRLERQAEEDLLNSSVTRQMRLIDRMRRKALW